MAFIALTVVIIAAAGAGAYFYKHKNKSQTASENTAVQTAPATISSQTKKYSSPNFYLSFNYPSDWTVTDKGGGVMTVVSPPIGLTSANGQKVTGQITLTFRNKSQPLPEFDKGNAVAALESQKVAYAHPSQSQRASTYVSFLTYSGSTSGIDGIYITGNTGYKAAQAIPKADFVPVDPIVNLTFAKCSDTQCTGKTMPLTISVSTWKNPQISTPLTKMLESLTIT